MSPPATGGSGSSTSFDVQPITLVASSYRPAGFRPADPSSGVQMRIVSWLEILPKVPSAFSLSHTNFLSSSKSKNSSTIGFRRRGQMVAWPQVDVFTPELDDTTRKKRDKGGYIIPMISLTKSRHRSVQVCPHSGSQTHSGLIDSA